jgi:hypothetical protein
MLWIAVAVVVVAVLLVAGWRLLRSDRLDEVDRFSRARQKTTGWANGEPPPEPVSRIPEDVQAEPAAEQEQEPAAR